MTIEDTLVKHLVEKTFDDLSAAAIHATKRSIIDTFAVMLAASSQSEEAAKILEMGMSAGGSEDCSVIAFGGKLPPATAAFVNGGLTHPLDFDDTHEIARIHPTAGCFASALAASEMKSDVSGKDFLAAVAVTNDVTCRLSLAVDATPPEHGWLTSVVFSYLGAAGAAARLLGLSEYQTKSALGIAYCQTGGSQEMGAGTGTYRAVRDAFTQQAGLLSTIMASKGIDGPHSFVSGEKGLFNHYFGGNVTESRAYENLGAVFEGEHVSFKKWPCCRLSQTYVTGLFDLMDEHGFSGQDIDRMDVVVSDWTKLLCEPEAERKVPASPMKAKYSIPFVLATAALNQDVRIESFEESEIRNPEVLGLASNVFYTVDNAISAGDFAPGDVKITLKDGRELKTVAPYAVGNPNKPMSDADIDKKFRDCARVSKLDIAPEAVERVLQKLWNIEGQTRFGDVIAELAPDHVTPVAKIA